MSRNLSILFAVFALIYIGLDNYVQFSATALFKIIPIGILFFAVVRTDTFAGKLLLLAALIFSAIGDTLLAFDYFIYGIGAFLIAQLSYASYFVRSWQGISQRKLLTTALLIYVLVMVWFLTPHLSDLRIPVFAYLIVISIMGVMAIQSSLPTRWAVLGALIFISSDSLIAINKFIHPLPASGEAIMLTYYAAQWMIISGCLTSRRTNG